MIFLFYTVLDSLSYSLPKGQTAVINSIGFIALYEGLDTLTWFQCSTKKWGASRGRLIIRECYHRKKATVSLRDRENHLNAKRREYDSTWIWELRASQAEEFLSELFRWSRGCEARTRVKRSAYPPFCIQLYWSSAEYTPCTGQAKGQVAVVHSKVGPC